jgi:hypothetical protein
MRYFRRPSNRSRIVFCLRYLFLFGIHALPRESQLNHSVRIRTGSEPTNTGDFDSSTSLAGSNRIAELQDSHPVFGIFEMNRANLFSRTLLIPGNDDPPLQSRSNALCQCIKFTGGVELIFAQFMF